jgi:FMN phosphatase YigB (HAD superfamily)
MSIKLITFDLDDTLWETAPAIVSAEAMLRDWLAEHAPKLGNSFAAGRGRSDVQAPDQCIASSGTVFGA